MRLDEFVPEWQFNEVHTRRIAGSPEVVFDAVRGIRADEIFLFRMLTWIRRFGRKLPESIINAGDDEPLLDVATRSGFVWLANDRPHELVVGTAVLMPKGRTECVLPSEFRESPGPGYALAAMNFLVTPDGAGSIVRTETRVFATDRKSRRRFALYWFTIYPGSAFIRRMWLRAIALRVERTVRSRTF